MPMTDLIQSTKVRATSTLLCLVLLRHTNHAWPAPKPPPAAPASTTATASRRSVLAGVGGLLTAAGATLDPMPSARADTLSDAVTLSDLGVAVRRSVVRGAQVMDRLDASWERASDRLGLGEARNQREQRPPPKVVPALRPLDGNLAAQLLEISDREVVRILSCSAADLQRRVDRVTALVGPTFARTGVDVSAQKLLQSGAEFNFLAYCHYRAYLDLFLNQRSVAFGAFKAELERAIGSQVLERLLPGFQRSPEASRCAQWRDAAEAVDRLGAALAARGLVRQVDPLRADAEALAAWCAEGGELTFSLALDGEVTLGAQTLLQEQGYNLYPNFGRQGILAILEGIPGTTVTMDDYYMDTDYNSDPDKFEVKELLLNIVLETP